jgi:hypothetical protein
MDRRNLRIGLGRQEAEEIVGCFAVNSWMPTIVAGTSGATAVTPKLTVDSAPMTSDVDEATNGALRALVQHGRGVAGGAQRPPPGGGESRGHADGDEAASIRARWSLGRSAPCLCVPNFTPGDRTDDL